MICPKCKTQNIDGSKFCEACGTPLTAPAPAPKPAPAAARHCANCGAELKPGARFCAGCGTPTTAAAPATAPTAAPAPIAQAAPPPPRSAPAPAAAPAPAPRSAPPPSAQSYAPVPQPAYGQPRQGGGGCGKGCGIGCGVLSVIMAVLVVAGYWAYSTILLSRPEAFVGTWELVEGKNTLGGEKFKLELVEGGVKVVPPDGTVAPIDIVLKPVGTRKLATTITNPQDPSQKAELSVELNGLGTQLTLAAKLPGGKTEEAKAKRTAGP